MFIVVVSRSSLVEGRDKPTPYGTLIAQMKLRPKKSPGWATAIFFRFDRIAGGHRRPLVSPRFNQQSGDLHTTELR